MAVNPFSDLHVNELTSFSFTHILRQHSIIKWLAKWVATNQACVFLVEMDRTNKLFALNIHLAFFIVHVGFLVTQRVYRKKLSLDRQTAASGKKLFPRRKKIIFCSPTLNQFTNNHPRRCFVTFPFWEFIWRKNEFDGKIIRASCTSLAIVTSVFFIYTMSLQSPDWKKDPLSRGLHPIFGTWYLLLTPICGKRGKGTEEYSGSGIIACEWLSWKQSLKE